MGDKKKGLSKAAFYAIIAFVVSFIFIVVVLNSLNSESPCHVMPNGAMMGDCDENLNIGMESFLSDEILPGEEYSISDLAVAKSTTIFDIENGETFEMTADIIKKTIDGKEIIMYGYNGMIPGPALRVKQGSRITIDFKNNIDMNTTVHWHGLRHDIKDDGVPGVSQDPTRPGESFTYELYFPDDGIYWYHPHVREDVQQDSGLSGNMLVTPTTPYNLVNQEELIILDDILLDWNGQVPFGGETANFAIMGRFGNVMLTNGEESYDFEVEKGSVVRLYLTNVANVRPFNFSVSGAKMKLVGGDLGEFEREEFVDSIVIAPAMRYFVDVYFPNSGEYNLMNINPHDEYVLGTVTVSKDEVSNSYVSEFNEDLVNQNVIDDIKNFEPYFNKPVDYSLDLTIDMGEFMDSMKNLPCHKMGGMVMGNCTSEEQERLGGEDHEELTIEWEDEMNMRAPGEMIEWIIRDAESKKENMDIGMNSKVGDVVKIKLFNDPESMHPMQHPIHLHGQRVIVTSIDGETVNNKVWTDTILVPIGTTVEMIVDVTNPGEWMMHCHIAEHLEAGMMTSFTVE